MSQREHVAILIGTGTSSKKQILRKVSFTGILYSTLSSEMPFENFCKFLAFFWAVRNSQQSVLREFSLAHWVATWLLRIDGSFAETDLKLQVFFRKRAINMTVENFCKFLSSNVSHIIWDNFSIQILKTNPQHNYKSRLCEIFKTKTNLSKVKIPMKVFWILKTPLEVTFLRKKTRFFLQLGRFKFSKVSLPGILCRTLSSTMTFENFFIFYFTMSSEKTFEDWWLFCGKRPEVAGLFPQKSHQHNC